MQLYHSATSGYQETILQKWVPCHDSVSILGLRLDGTQRRAQIAKPHEDVRLSELMNIHLPRNQGHHMTEGLIIFDLISIAMCHRNMGYLITTFLSHIWKKKKATGIFNSSKIIQTSCEMSKTIWDETVLEHPNSAGIWNLKPAPSPDCSSIVSPHQDIGILLPRWMGYSTSQG